MKIIFCKIVLNRNVNPKTRITHEKVIVLVTKYIEKHLGTLNKDDLSSSNGIVMHLRNLEEIDSARQIESVFSTILEFGAAKREHLYPNRGLFQELFLPKGIPDEISSYLNHKDLKAMRKALKMDQPQQAQVQSEQETKEASQGSSIRQQSAQLIEREMKEKDDVQKSPKQVRNIEARALSRSRNVSALTKWLTKHLFEDDSLMEFITHMNLDGERALRGTTVPANSLIESRKLPGTPRALRYDVRTDEEVQKLNFPISLRELSLRPNENLTKNIFEILAKEGVFRRLETFRYHFPYTRDIGNDMYKTLVRFLSEDGLKLVKLDLSMDLDIPWNEILSQKVIEQLTSLQLCWNPLDESNVLLLIRNAKSLRELKIGCLKESKAYEALAQSTLRPRYFELRTLNYTTIQWNRSSGLILLLNSPFFERTEVLSLPISILGDNQPQIINTIARSTHFSNLKILRIRSDRFSMRNKVLDGKASKAAIALAKNSKMPKLSRLSILTWLFKDLDLDIFLKNIAQNPYFSNLTSIRVIRNACSEAGIIALAESPYLRLRKLKLNIATELTKKGIDALKAMELDELQLEGPGLTPAVKQALEDTS